jgi:hypothetical protein
MNALFTESVDILFHLVVVLGIVHTHTNIFLLANIFFMRNNVQFVDENWGYSWGLLFTSSIN